MSASRQLPSSLVAAEFGEVNIRPLGIGRNLEVTFTIAMEPQGEAAEGWQTGVALDASASMYTLYGKALLGDPPTQVLADFKRRKLISTQTQDGEEYLIWEPAGVQEALKKGYVRYSTNDIEAKAREFISYLADNLDADGGTTVAYWACGDGSDYEVLGDFTAEECKTLAITGPTQTEFGTGTKLLPMLKYFCERFRDAKRGMYIFLTDGRLDDLEAVKTFTKRLCQAIAAGQRNPVKCVLIGIGDGIDEGQMEQLDDLDTGTPIDVWDHKLAKEMRSLIEIFAEVVDENTIIAPTAHLEDATGKVVKTFTDGLPSKVTFTLPATSAYFELVVGDGRIRQPVR
jgi:hypothetical protein